MPKHTLYGAKTIEIAAFFTACIFKEGFSLILKIIDAMDVQIGVYAEKFAATRDAECLRQTECLAAYESYEQRKARRTQKLNQEERFEEVEGLLYGSGIAD